jgi:EAL domain-containing protein (putative c-di-GMP-specific phosphodiesterase class I)
VPGSSATEVELGRALADGQFVLMYQPIYDLGDLSLVGFESLLRWNHPTLGQMQPDAFLAALEASGQIVEVGRWVLLEACEQMAGWRCTGSPLTVSVNVSARQLSRDGLIDDVRAALEHSGLEPAALTIEVAETALQHNPEAIVRRLHGLKNLGVQLAIDDFGTGHSSLAYLRQFPVDCLKIDRTFIDAITRSPQADALIHTLVQLGQDLGLTTLAEGVETTEQMTQLRAENVNSVQGFLFARPLSVQVIDEDILRADPDPA